MASLRGLRKSSRMSSPATTTTPLPKEKDNSPGEAIRVKSDGKTFLDKWVEPPLRDPAPSFEDYKGLERHGVLEKMVPLGQKPTPKLLQRLKLLPSKNARQSTPLQNEDDIAIPSNGVPSRADTVSPADGSPLINSFEVDDTAANDTSRQAHSASLSTSAVPETQEDRPQRPATRSPRAVRVSTPTPVVNPSTVGSQTPTTPQATSSMPGSNSPAPSRNKEQLQKVLSAALAESDFRRDHVANLGLRNFWTEAAHRPDLLTTFAKILDGTARKHERRVFNRFILNAKEFLRSAPPIPPPQSQPSNPYPGTSRSGRMNGTIIEFTTPIVSQPPRSAQQRRAAPQSPASAPASAAVQLQNVPVTKPSPLPAMNGVKRKREDDGDGEEEKRRVRSRSLSSISSLSDAKSLDDEIYAPKQDSVPESESEKARDLRVDGDAVMAIDKGGEANSKTRAPTETSEKSRQVPSRSAARTANNNLASSFRQTTSTRSNITNKPKGNDYAHDAYPGFPNSEPKNWSDKKEKLEQALSKSVGRDKHHSKDLNPPTKKDAKNRNSIIIPLTEEEQREVDEQRRLLHQNSYSIRESDFPESSLRSPASASLYPLSDTSIDTPRATPKPDIKVHPLSKIDAQLLSSPLEPTSSQRELRNGSVRKRPRNEFEDAEEAATPGSTAPADHSASVQRVTARESRAGTPRGASRPTKKLDLKKSARVIQSPQKKTGITAGMPRNASTKQHGASNGAEDDDTDNDEECSACGGAGELICCDGCPHAFHFSCVDPPLKAVPEGQWFCSRCAAERSQVGQSDLGIFNKVVKNYDEELPVSYALPKLVQDYWDCVRRGSNGEYEEYAEPKTQDTFKLNRAGLVEIPDPKRLRDKDGTLLVCHRCKRVAASNRELVSCDYCPAKWHMDCVDHPMATSPRRRPHDKAGSTWKCPLHADDVLAEINAKNNSPDMVFDKGRLPKVRKPKRAIPYDPVQRRGYRNNGNIQVFLEEEQDPVFKTVDWMGQQVRLSEQAIKLDFVDKARTARLREKFMAAQMGLPVVPDDTYRPFVVGRIPGETSLGVGSPKGAFPAGRSALEREAANVLLSISRTQLADICNEDWQDSIILGAATLIRGEQASEQGALLKVQAMIASRLADIEQRSEPTHVTPKTPVQDQIEALTEHAEAEAANHVGKSLRSGKKIADPENGIENDHEMEL